MDPVRGTERVRRGVRGSVFFLLALLVLSRAVPILAPALAQEKAIRDMTPEELAAHLARKRAAYKPPEAATKVLPFDPKGWKTNQDYDCIGDPKAKKGGQITSVWASYPPNLRADGPNSNLLQTRTIHTMVYESMVGLHPTTLKFIPQLATHWWLSEDKRTYRFRLDPRARFSDGSEVTADDVYWSFWHLTQEDRKDPYNVILYAGSFEMPKIIDKYTIEVTTKELNWRLFLYFGGSMFVYPAEYIYVTGDEYIEGYQWNLIPGSGPYLIKPGDIKKPATLTLTRRPDHWAKEEKWAIGLYNFDRINFRVIADRELEFQRFQHGELDYYFVRKAQRWVEECNFEAVRKGWVKKRRIKTEAPQGFSGFCFNMRKPPFDDKNVRLAWAYLFNREKLIEKLFFNQYDFIDSYYPGRIWANPENRKIRFNPRRAAGLLARAGYKERNEQGILVGPDGKPFEVTMEIGSPDLKRIFTVVQEDFLKAGIRLNLKQIDFRTLYKKVRERQFTVHYQSWGAIVFPNPESSWMSELADKPQNNNVAGFKSRRVDRLCKEYDECFDQAKRVELIREIDGLIFREYPYALGWYSNRVRVLFWRKFGHPARYFARTGDERNILSEWWYDPALDKELQDARASGKALEQGPVEVQPWDDLGEQRLPDDDARRTGGCGPGGRTVAELRGAR